MKVGVVDENVRCGLWNYTSTVSVGLTFTSVVTGAPSASESL